MNTDNVGLHLGVGWEGLIINMTQELITRSLQLPHVPVTAFPQTDLFLV